MPPFLIASNQIGDWAYLKGENSTKSFHTPEGYKQTASTVFAYHAVLKKVKNNEPAKPESKKASNSNNSSKTSKPEVVEPA